MGRVFGIGAAALLVCGFLFYVLTLCGPVGNVLFFLFIICPVVVLFGIKFFKAVAQAGRDQIVREEYGKSMDRQLKEQEERKIQIDALKAALPKAPPQRMRATIRVNPVVNFVLLPKNSYDRTLENTDITRYAVDMILEMPEKDRELIRQEHLDRVVIDKVPKYTTDQILNIAGQRELKEAELRRGGRFEDHVALEALKYEPERSVASYQAETRDIMLGDFLRVPYSQVFDTKPAANDYADKLKNVVLPRIKVILEKSEDRDFSETIEL